MSKCTCASGFSVDHLLTDDTHTYLYGNMRLAQETTTTTEYFLTDALGSVRQLVDENGMITLAQTYQPYGETLSSASDGGATNYAFAGEWCDASGLDYLRARYYAPWQGRFITKDVWPGDYTRPLSLNAWNYVEGNPVNRTDPTGFAACQERGGGRYCVLNNGGFIDTAHYRGGKVMASDLLDQLKSESARGVKGHPILAHQPFFPGLPEYALTYRASIPEEGLQEGVLKRVALGIFMDFQIRYETFQGVDPRCLHEFLDQSLEPILNGLCSSFSNEDLVSDYLGFIDYVSDDINFEFVIEALGGGSAQAEHPTGYYPKNFKFTSFRLLEVDDCGNLNIIQRHLPPSLSYLRPLEAGSYWDVPENYERTVLNWWL